MVSEKALSSQSVNRGKRKGLGYFLPSKVAQLAALEPAQHLLERFGSDLHAAPERVIEGGDGEQRQEMIAANAPIISACTTVLPRPKRYVKPTTITPPATNTTTNIRAGRPSWASTSRPRLASLRSWTRS